MKGEKNKVLPRILKRIRGENWEEYKEREKKDWNALIKAMKKIKEVNRNNYSADVLKSYHWIYTEESNETFQFLKKECDKNEFPPDVCVGRSELTGGPKYRFGNHGDIKLMYAGLERIKDDGGDPFPSASQYLLVRNKDTKEAIGLLLMGDIEAMPNFIDYCDDNGDNGFRIIGYRFQDPIAIKRRKLELEKSAKIEELKELVLYPLAAIVIFISLIFIVEKCRGVI